MAEPSDKRRRRMGFLCLGIAGLQIIVGQILLRDQLQGRAFIFYWLGCFGFTFLALFIALLDLWIIRLRLRRERRQLLAETIRSIAREKEKHKHDQPEEGT